MGLRFPLSIEPMSPTQLNLALLAFIAPIAVVGFLNREQIAERLKVDPETAPGKVLYFTVPAR